MEMATIAKTRALSSIFRNIYALRQAVNDYFWDGNGILYKYGAISVAGYKNWKRSG